MKKILITQKSNPRHWAIYNKNRRLLAVGAAGAWPFELPHDIDFMLNAPSHFYKITTITSLHAKLLGAL